MLLNKTIQVKWNNATKNHYISKGYKYTKINDVFEVDINDLIKTSTIRVNVKCDYCGKIHSKEYRKYINKRLVVNKDCCSNNICKNRKQQDVNMELYNVKHSAQRSDVKDKLSKSKRRSIEYVMSVFEDKNLILINGLDSYKNRDSVFEFVCKKHSNIIQSKTFESIEGSICPCYICKNEDNITPFSIKIRNQLTEWKKSTELKYNFKCDLSKSDKYHIHHLKPFKSIVKEAISNLGVDMENITVKDVEYIKKESVRLHMYYGEGVCLHPELHYLFHSEYKKETTYDDYIEFKSNYFKGVYNHKIKDDKLLPRI